MDERILFRGTIQSRNLLKTFEGILMQLVIISRQREVNLFTEAKLIIEICI